MECFVSPHSLKLIVLNVIMLPFTRSNILQTISITKAVLRGGTHVISISTHGMKLELTPGIKVT